MQGDIAWWTARKRTEMEPGLIYEFAVGTCVLQQEDVEKPAALTNKRAEGQRKCSGTSPSWSAFVPADWETVHMRLAALAVYGNSPRLNHFLISAAFTTGLDWRLGALQTHCFIKPHWPLKQQESFYRHTCTLWWSCINGSYKKWTNLI